MNELKINPENARKAYNQAKGAVKEALGILLGEDIVNQKITDRVTSFETACEVLELDPDDELPYNEERLSSRRLAINAFAKMQTIALALNGRELTDNEDHYYPYFNRSSGFGLSYGVYGYACSNSFVGSRLSYLTPELATYAGKTFLKIYQDFMTTVQGNPTGNN